MLMLNVKTNSTHTRKFYFIYKQIYVMTQDFKK